ncbi:hypothetical protein LHJ74_31890 [Streptomyces sp. N2-109]|uniref:Lipoprotein n=1 Tax=Streptomyces gossypii TaxID=2883101 RepID=A0ABT2K2R5_9ACTN|nr:hypothetical protein [Streptomyces gossypii]MCT2594457.1 hypothetical protein [Streptomyces gossypii]
MSARRRRLTALAVGAITVGTAISGCGIRSTPVPVDAGAAPSRVACVVPGSDTVAVPDGATVRVYLVCGSRVAPVERTVQLPENRMAFARALLDELQEHPGGDEESAGFESAVPRDLEVAPGEDDDPEGTLRLNTPLDDLPSFALAQLVCSYTESGASGDDGSVIIGGPAGPEAKPLQRFACGTALRGSPEAAATAGTPV